MISKKLGMIAAICAMSVANFCFPAAALDDDVSVGPCFDFTFIQDETGQWIMVLIEVPCTDEDILG